MLIRLVALAGTILFLFACEAQSDEGATSEAAYSAKARDAAAITLDVGASEHDHSEVWSDMGPNEIWVRNVTQPTLLPVLPDPEKATGAAVLIVPGGGFQFVSITNEGYPIADWFADRGIAAFVLKYRVMKTPESQEGFEAHLGRMWSPQPGDAPIRSELGIPHAVADAKTALKLLKERSEEWGINSERIGMLGFSAGAITTMGVISSEEEVPKLDFAGYIYGPMTSIDVPASAPPLFVGLAADDPLFAHQGFGLVTSWRSAGKPIEFHLYESGGHGFGSKTLGESSDLWLEQFYKWLETRDVIPG